MCTHSFIITPYIQKSKKSISFISSSSNKTTYASKSSFCPKRCFNKLFVYQPIRPTVKCQSQKYKNMFRKGRGFTLNELFKSSISINDATNMNIPVDHRRKSYSDKNSSANTLLLKKYIKLWEFNNNYKDITNNLKSCIIKVNEISIENIIKINESNEYLIEKPNNEKNKNTVGGKKKHFSGRKNKLKHKVYL
jgi:ribosomal protein L13E